MPLDKPLESITEADLQTLVADGVVEGKAIEYKESLPDHTYEPKKEFLADVSSFANAAGGHLIFGIREENGVAVEVCGLPGIDPDGEVLRLENLIRDNVEQRIPGVSMRAVPLSTSDVAIVIRVPRSWAGPHAVNYRKHWRFYCRNSAGKYPLDVSEVRAAFALSETLGERMRLFRTERLGRVVAGETPVLVGETAKIVLHMVPFGAFDASATFDIRSLERDTWALKPIAGPLAGQRYNLDGLVVYGHPGRAYGRSYVQLFRNGIVEAVETTMLESTVDDEKLPHIPGAEYEKRLLKSLPNYLSIQERLGVAPPLFVMLSLLGVSGYNMDVKFGLDLAGDYGYGIDRDALVLPEIIIESFEIDPVEVMRPIFDTVWNAAGWPRSMNYDDAGVWCKGPNCSS